MTHGLNEKLMMGYAAGTLPEAFELVVASHIALNEDSRAGVHAHEAIGGALLEEQTPAELSEGALEATLALLDKPITEKQMSPRLAEPTAKAVFPPALQAYVGGDADAVQWQSIGGGIKQAILPTQGEATARLLYIPAGQAVPDHGHRGTELTLVLQGAFADEVDRFGRGDLEIADEDLDHKPIAEAGEPCICLAATDAPLRFNELIPRMLQPIFKI